MQIAACTAPATVCAWVVNAWCFDNQPVCFATGVCCSGKAMTVGASVWIPAKKGPACCQLRLHKLVLSEAQAGTLVLTDRYLMQTLNPSMADSMRASVRF